MKRIFNTLILAFVLSMAFSTVLHADTPQLPPDNSSAELNRIKALAGRWMATTSMFGVPDQKVYTEYTVTAGGSAVLERIFPGTPQEMVSVYYDNKGKLTMTHYCIMRNRPTLTLASSNGDTLLMDVEKIEDLKSKKDHSMGAMTIQFKDKDHFVTTCSGKGKEKPHSMEYTRVNP